VSNVPVPPVGVREKVPSTLVVVWPATSRADTVTRYVAPFWICDRTLRPGPMKLAVRFVTLRLCVPVKACSVVFVSVGLPNVNHGDTWPSSKSNDAACWSEKLSM